MLRQTLLDSTADYTIVLNTPTGARTVELHQGSLGQNGPLVATLWNGDSKADQVRWQVYPFSHAGSH